MKKRQKTMSIEKSRQIKTVKTNLIFVNSKTLKTTKLNVSSFYKMVFFSQMSYDNK
jgi:hypothetical protein